MIIFKTCRGSSSAKSKFEQISKRFRAVSPIDFLPFNVGPAEIRNPEFLNTRIFAVRNFCADFNLEIIC